MVLLTLQSHWFGKELCSSTEKTCQTCNPSAQPKRLRAAGRPYRDSNTLLIPSFPLAHNHTCSSGFPVQSHALPVIADCPPTRSCCCCCRCCLPGGSADRHLPVSANPDKLRHGYPAGQLQEGGNSSRGLETPGRFLLEKLLLTNHITWT